MIPRNLILTGSREHFESQEVTSSLQALKTRNEGWQIMAFTDEQQIDFIAKSYSSEVIAAYHRINPNYGAAKADLFRYLAVYKLGGVYLDIKSTCSVPLSAVIRSDDELLLAQWDNQIGRPYERWGISPDVWYVPGGEYVNWFFAAEPNNPILLAVIKKVLYNIISYKPSANLLGRNGILRVTGPLAWTQSIFSTITSNRTEGDFRVRIENCRDLCLGYSIFDDPSQPNGLMRHRQVFQDHYTKSEEPVILPTQALAGTSSDSE